MLWAWTQHKVYRTRYAAMMADPQWRHLHFERLQSRRDVEAWVEGLGGPKE